MAKKSGNKTTSTGSDVGEFVASIEDERKRTDAETVLALMQRITGEKPKMWGASIIGFGSRDMVYESGREVEWFHVGFSPRKQNLTLYIMDGFANYDVLLSKLGKHTTGKSCLYVKRLEQIDMDVLEELVAESVKAVSGSA